MNPIHVVSGSTNVLDVLGSTIEFLTSPSEGGDMYCIMQGHLPASMWWPLHSHADAETFFVLSGRGQILIERGARLEWVDVKQGDFVHILSGVKHAQRNPSQEPFVELVTTTARLGQFFLEIGRPVQPGVSLLPTAEDLDRFRSVAARYGHWFASSAENAAVGLSL